MSKRTLRVATRSSALALWQAEFIKAELERLHDNVVVELIKIKTQGDKILDVPLAKIGGKGLFVKEDRKSTRLNSSHVRISYAVFCLKKKNEEQKERSAEEKQKSQPEITSTRRSQTYMSRTSHLGDTEPSTA